jgi:hypothetical protein
MCVCRQSCRVGWVSGARGGGRRSGRPNACRSERPRGMSCVSGGNCDMTRAPTENVPVLHVLTEVYVENECPCRTSVWMTGPGCVNLVRLRGVCCGPVLCMLRFCGLRANVDYFAGTEYLMFMLFDRPGIPGGVWLEGVCPGQVRSAWLDDNWGRGGVQVYLPDETSVRVSDCCCDSTTPLRSGRERGCRRHLEDSRDQAKGPQQWPKLLLL